MAVFNWLLSGHFGDVSSGSGGSSNSNDDESFARREKKTKKNSQDESRVVAAVAWLREPSTSRQKAHPLVSVQSAQAEPPSQPIGRSVGSLSLGCLCRSTKMQRADEYGHSQTHTHTHTHTHIHTHSQVKDGDCRH